MDKAAHTVAKVAEGMRKEQSTCLPGMLRTIQNLTRRLQDLAVQELSDVIKDDPVLMEKIIKVSNSIGFNPAGIEITSISEAIQVVGFNRIRNLTMSLILFEEAHKNQPSEERREALLACLTSGILSEQLAAETGTLDPEVAFLGGTLRGFGRILLATYLLDDYQQAEALSEQLTPDGAYREIFGLTPIELSYQLMEASHLSPALLSALQDYHPARHKRELENPEERLLGIADYGYQLALISIDPEIGQDAYPRLRHALEERYSGIVQPTAEQLERMLKRASKHLRALVVANGADTFPERALSCLQHRVEHKDLPAIPPAAQPPAAAAAPGGAPARSEAPRRPSSANPVLTETFKSGIERLEEFAAEEARIRAAAIDNVLKVLKSGLAAEEAWVFLRDNRDPDRFQYKSGLGTHTMFLQDKVLRAREASIFGLCLARAENIFINDVGQPNVKKHIPAWFANNVSLKSFILLVLKHEETVLGLVLVGWRKAGDVTIHPEHTKLVRRLLGLVANIHVPGNSVD